ncbi:hypothetical protein RHMOL_Rhmol08G0097100 [Rhododendron molle]|uniref:Uncharacterized protein n=1 Tax=Rhododendron molle TaxID=49168 RepID=A0ACC0MN10_RHOML|nr:hypothetical protein RHMOL_Rhmol08G0097100 [Rhododendron molle]
MRHQLTQTPSQKAQLQNEAGPNPFHPLLNNGYCRFFGITLLGILLLLRILLFLRI